MEMTEMPDIDKLHIEIDCEECIGDGMCVNEAPETFELNDDSKAILRDGSTDELEYILDAARACPLDIIKVVDKESGQQLYPEG